MVDGGLFFSGFFFDNDIWGVSGGFVGSSSGVMVSRFFLFIEIIVFFEEDGYFVVKDFFVSFSVGGGDFLFDNSGVVFVNNFDEFIFGDEFVGGGDWVFFDFEVLFVVEEYYGVEVGNEVVK